MTGVATAEAQRVSPVARLLEAPRFEVIPVRGIEDKMDGLAPGTTVTVTASPSHGIERTVEVSERLAARGLSVVPHLAARMLRSRGELEEVAARLAAAGVSEVFVIGGDASPPAGEFSDAAGLLEALRTVQHPFARIGVGGYPEGHPKIADDALVTALLRKQADAAYLVTQLCFDAAALERWIASLREQGVTLPIVVGLPGVVDRGKLVEVSLLTGVGASLSYLRRHGREVAALMRRRQYDPGPLARAVATRLTDPALDVRGVHLFTFNQVAQTQDWVRSLTS